MCAHRCGAYNLLLGSWAVLCEHRGLPGDRRSGTVELRSAAPLGAGLSCARFCAATDGVLPKFLRGGGAGTAEVGSLRQESSGETSKRV